MCFSDICTICYDDENNKNIISLECGHTLHKKCFKKLFDKKNEICTCPLCRVKINKAFYNTLFFNEHKDCYFCKENIDFEENNVNCVELSVCGCKMHYTCWSDYVTNRYKGERELIPKNTLLECPKCSEEMNYYDINALDYGYFKRSFELWVDFIHKCFDSHCCYEANPQRFGFCQNHCSNKASNKNIKDTLRFMHKFGSIWSIDKKINIFYKVLKHLEENNESFNFDENIELFIKEFKKIEF